MTKIVIVMIVLPYALNFLAHIFFPDGWRWAPNPSLQTVKALPAPLPENAARIVTRIEALLAQAAPLLPNADVAVSADEPAFALRETERRYLPDTIRAYREIPPALRDDTATDELVSQLTILERATHAHLARIAENAELALGANRRFLTERFPDATTPAPLLCPVHREEAP